MSVLVLDGELTIYRAAELKKLLVDAVAAGGRVDVDLGQVSALDSAGVQLLLLARAAARAKEIPIAFSGHSPVVVEVLELLGLRGDL